MRINMKLVDIILDSDIEALETIFYRRQNINFTYIFTKERINQIFKIIQNEVNNSEIFTNFNEVLIEQGIINHFNKKENIKIFTNMGEIELTELSDFETNITYSICGQNLTINYQNKDSIILTKQKIDCNDWGKIEIISKSIDENVFNKYKNLKWIEPDTKDYIYCLAIKKILNINASIYKISDYNFYIQFSNALVIPNINSSVIKNWCDFKKDMEISKYITIDTDKEIGITLIQKGKYGVYEENNSIKFCQYSDNKRHPIPEDNNNLYLIEYLKCCLWILYYNKYNDKQINFDKIKFDYNKSKYYFEYKFKFEIPFESASTYIIPPKNFIIDDNISLELKNSSIKVSSNNMWLDRRQHNDRNKRITYNKIYSINTKYTEEIFQKELVNTFFEYNDYLFPLFMTNYKCEIAIDDNEIDKYIISKDNQNRWLKKIIDLAIKKGYIYIENGYCYYINVISQPNKFYKNVLQKVITEGSYMPNIEINKEYNLVNKLLYFWGNKNKKYGIINIEEYSFDNIKSCYERMEESEVSELIKYAVSRLMFAWLLDNSLFDEKLNDAKKIHRTVREFMEQNYELRKELVKLYLYFISSLEEENLYTERVLLMRSCFEKDDFETGSDEQKRYLACFQITERENLDYFE